jgi:hypothetical protein
MKQLLFILFIAFVSASCSKTSTNPSNSNTGKTFGYSVWCSKGTWSGSYVDERNDQTQINSADSGWVYTGTIPLGRVANLIFSSDLAGNPSDTAIYCIGTVYVNGTAVKTDTVKSTGQGHTINTDGQILYTIN